MPFEELLDWASNENRPAWQRDALRRLAEHGELTEDDLSVMRKQIEVSQGLSSEEAPELVPLDGVHLSEAGSDAPKTVLASLGPIKHVDRLEPEQPPMRFTVEGITLIYGANGSGKSGYCRVAKQLCRSLAPDKLRGNVYDVDPAPPAEVGVGFRIGDEGQPKTELTWRGNQPAPPELARISVFDTASARVYVDKERKIEFLPYELDLLNKLGLAARALNGVFKEREDAINTTLRVSLPTGYRENTSVSSLLATLVPETEVGNLPTEQQIQDLANWSDDNENQLNTLIEQSRNDPSTMARLRKEAQQALEAINNDMLEVSGKIGGAAVQLLSEKQNDAEKKDEVAIASAGDLFKSEPIPDVGSEAWRQMLAYAREFAAEAFPDVEQPKIASTGRCVLCQQELDDAANTRLVEFDKYLSERAAGEAATAKAAFDQAVSEVARLRIKSRDDVATFLAGYSALSGERTKFAEDIRDLFDKANIRLLQIKQALEDRDYEVLANLEFLPDPPRQRIADDLEALASEIEELERLARDGEAARERAKKLDELSDRKRLGQEIDVIVERRNNLEERLKLRACWALCRLTPITQQITSRRRDLLTPTLRDALEDELKALRLTHIPLDLNDRGELGNSIVEVALTASQRVANNSEILSEGEQRGLALACFLAELQEIGRDHGIIVDDPVSSLDHSRMQAVARRLAEEAAKGRQVIVFTHNILFHHMLTAEVRRYKVLLHKEWMSSLRDDRFGIIDDAQKPRQMKNVSERLKKIDVDRRRLSDAGYDHNDERFRQLVVSLYTQMRDTWERTVEEILLNGVVQRFRPEIMTQRLEEACIDPENDYPLIFEGMKRCSHYSGHDPAEDLPTELPEVAQIQEDAEALKGFASVARERRAQRRNARSYEKGVAPVLL